MSETVVDAYNRHLCDRIAAAIYDADEEAWAKDRPPWQGLSAERRAMWLADARRVLLAAFPAQLTLPPSTLEVSALASAFPMLRERDIYDLLCAFLNMRRQAVVKDSLTVEPDAPGASR